MSSARIGGGIAGLILLVLLGLVTWRWWNWQPVVMPSTHISAVGKASPEQILAERTRMQRDRSDSGPGVYPDLAKGDQRLVADNRGGVANAPQVVDRWLTNRVNDEMILQRQREVFGWTSVPYREMNVLEQPQGRDWRATHNSTVRFGGGWLIFGTGLALALFLLARGRIKLAEGWSGKTVLRFNAIERANHWMTATAFVILALTGIIILYGKPLLMPLIGEYPFATLASWSAWLHMASMVPFILGIVLMAVLWMKGNLFNAGDWEWLKQGGGFFNDSPDKPAAHRFNAGQKFTYWGVTLGGLAAFVTGLMLMFPFFLLGYDGMQWAQLIHASIGLAMIALIIGHIYIGSIGMEGAFDAMWNGCVDRNWAREHHRSWLEQTDGQGQAAPPSKRE